MRGTTLGVLFVAILSGGCKNDLPATLTPGQTLTVKGEITAGTECPMLATAGGRQLSLAGNLGRFKPGDRVCIRGRVAEVSFCMAGEGTISITAIGPENECP